MPANLIQIANQTAAVHICQVVGGHALKSVIRL